MRQVAILFSKRVDFIRLSYQTGQMVEFLVTEATYRGKGLRKSSSTDAPSWIPRPIDQDGRRGGGPIDRVSTIASLAMPPMKWAVYKIGRL